MKHALLIVLSVWSPYSKGDKCGTVFQSVYLGLHAADYATSKVAFVRGGTEGNPFQTRREPGFSLVSAMTAGAANNAFKALGYAQTHSQRYRRFIKVERYAIIGLGIAVESYAVQNNIRVARQLRQGGGR